MQWGRSIAAALLAPALGFPAATTVVTAPAAHGGVAAGENIETVREDAPFFAVPDAATLAASSPGTPLKVRQLPLHVAEFATPLQVTQVQHRTTNTLGAPSAAVTSVIHPPEDVPGLTPTGNTVMYASFYDSMDPQDGPSRALSGTVTEGGQIVTVEMAFIAPLLASGHTVVVPDIQGEEGIFAAGPEYGQIILDGLRASHRTPEAGVDPDAPTALTGYSGGSIGAGWASIIAPEYAPEIAPHIVGVAQGGTMVRPEHNLFYAAEGSGWSGVVGMAIVGMTRAYGIDMDPYLTEYGKEITRQLDRVAIGDASDRFEHLRWEEIVLPEYPDIDSIPEVKAMLDDTNMALRPAPGSPQLLVQAGGGESENTPPHPEYGDGDGVMLLGDTRTLARKYCGAGTPVDYREIPEGGHALGGAAWAAQMVPWVNDRFTGVAAPSTCGSVPAGNPLTD
ncbi:MAG: lipase family protein [Mycobacteriaceae bacterium]|uniref:lipase family protein n=1 Tax=Corynebacterium sp. TaxID=1720 RepID=UPI003F9D928A